MLPFRYQLLGHALVALLLTLLLAFTLVSEQTVVDQGSAPFVNRAQVMSVTAVLYPEKPPKIAAVKPLENGRLSLTRPGPYRLSLQDVAGHELHALSFSVTFSVPGMAEELDEARQIFVLPLVEGSEKLVLTAPQGVTEYDLHQNLAAN